MASEQAFPKNNTAGVIEGSTPYQMSNHSVSIESADAYAVRVCVGGAAVLQTVAKLRSMHMMQLWRSRVVEGVSASSANRLTMHGTHSCLRNCRL